MWSKIDDKFPDHPKVMQAGPLASWLWICGTCYCNRYLTDGFIPVGQVRKLADVDNALELAERLVEAGLWESVEGGYQVHDFHDHNMTAEEAKAHREEVRQVRSEAGAKGAASRWQKHSKPDGKLPSKSDGKPDGKNMAPNPNPNPNQNPVPEPEEGGREDAPDPPPRPLEIVKGTAKPKPILVRATVIPDDFRLTVDMKVWAMEKGFDQVLNLKEETEEFIAYWSEGEGMGEKRKNWLMVWQTRMRERAERLKALSRGARNNGPKPTGNRMADAALRNIARFSTTTVEPLGGTDQYQLRSGRPDTA